MFTLFEPGTPAKEGSVPLCVPEIKGNEWKYIKECLDTNYISSVGPFVDRFEQMVADYIGSKYAIATVNGSAALHIALLVAGVQPDDEVIVSTLTFIAPVNAIRYVGAWPIFIDAEPEYWQMDSQKVFSFLENECIWRNGTIKNKKTGRRVSAIIPVHILGHPCDTDPIIELANKYNLKVIEDAAESIGSLYKGRKVGHLGDIACLSFNGNKIITTGGGGMIVTDNEAWARKAKYLTTQAKDDPIEYIHKEVGYNYRLTNIQAAMGCAQMELLDDYILAKRNIARTYQEKLIHVPGISFMKEASWAYSTYWLFTILVNNEQYGSDSRSLLQKLAKDEIQTRPLWQPIHCSPIYVMYQSPLPVAEYLNNAGLSLPCSVSLAHQFETLNFITQRINDYCSQSIKL